MKTNWTRAWRMAVISIVIAALVVPAAALAVPKTGSQGRGAAVSAAARVKARGTSTQNKGKGLGLGNKKDWTPERIARLRAFIAALLVRRANRFDNVASNVDRRITRVSALADTVAGAGGNVAEVRTLLDSARALLEAAKVEEAKAVDMFNAIPDAVNKRAAFKAARNQSKVALWKLRDARRTTTQAIVKLVTEIERLLGQTGSSTTSPTTEPTTE